VDAQGDGPVGERVLVVRGLSGHRLSDVDLEVHAGEVVGVAGLLGSGREQVGGLCFGALERTAGEVSVGGTPVAAGSPREAMRSGMAYVPADRALGGAVLAMNVRENLTIARLAPVTRAGYRVSTRAERAEARIWIERFDVRPRDTERNIANLSGGNQQKVILAKWLRNDPAVLVLDEPTQGIDVAAKAAIYGLIREATAQGAGVLIASSDGKELSLLCDRVVVLRDGRVVSELRGPALSESALEHEAHQVQPLEFGRSEPMTTEATHG
jgi:ribose transport system ATP-binding protein